MENGLARLIEDFGFRDDVLHGLSGHRRSVPSRWLYADRGSELYEEITRLEEYYPTRTEAGTRLAELGGWDVAELWTDAERLFAVFGLVAAEPAQGS